MGVEATLNEVRCTFWIIRGRQTVKKIISTCVIRKRCNARSLLPPPSPHLPGFRVASEYCFQFTGTDFAGPLFVKDVFSDDGKLYKCYICLFTCATSRAIHLELTPSVEAPGFIRAFNRFMARRGLPSVLISDNAKSFKNLQVKEYLIKCNIKHKPILASAPWWGGFYERMVRTIKSSIKKSIGKARLTYEEIETVLIEVEGVINSRPLTYLYEDDIQDPITPSHLMFGRNLHTQIHNSIQSIGDVNLNARVKYVNRIINLFWDRFSLTYLNSLREFHMYVNSKVKARDRIVLKLVNVVLVKEKPLPRSRWRTGLVEKLVKGTDGQIRGAELRSISKSGRPTKLSRPLQKIIPLEVQTESQNAKTEDCTETSVEDTNTKRSVPRRKAAVDGEISRRIKSVKKFM